MEKTPYGYNTCSLFTSGQELRISRQVDHYYFVAVDNDRFRNRKAFDLPRKNEI